MIDKQTIIKILVESESIQPVSKNDIIAEKLLSLIQDEINAAYQEGYESAHLWWDKDSSEYYK